MYSQGMNDIAAPIILVFIADSLKLAIEDLETYFDTHPDDISEHFLLTVNSLFFLKLITSLKLMLISALPISCR